MSRLIDADAYSAEMKKRQDACEKLMHDAERWNDVTLMGRANSAFSVFAEAKLTLDKMPTVDAVKHGEWVHIQRPNGKYYTGCSVCSFPIPTDSMFDYMDETDNRFCYNCGAKMDLTQSNDSNVLDALDGKEQE